MPYEFTSTNILILIFLCFGIAMILWIGMSLIRFMKEIILVMREQTKSLQGLQAKLSEIERTIGQQRTFVETSKKEKNSDY